ncbi:aminoglycoside phosphotransferase [Thermincola ferriacetica]|uniref:Aminoglycoside phosphotransferase n=1 Tax=Thermincola ferriacetica TaxID=281456 RepID=A0A0L6W014_9FIRM|nr:phosphotransferase [Thermincola ferriacetica]KNZ68753.1 aminoglycoside phosphotransferase [Thermincola ferriacetica]
MNLSNMHRLTPLDTDQTLSLVSQSGQLKNIAIKLSELLEGALVYSQIVSVFTHYDLGTVTDVYQMLGGYVNKSYGVCTEKNGIKHWYFVRMYKSGITESEIQLEHSLIDFCIANGLDIAAGLIRTHNQKTYVKISEDNNGKAVDRFFAVYDFLPGEDKYTWDNPTLNDKEYVSMAEALATFHNAARNFDPQGRERVEPRIMELLPMLPVLFKEFAERKNESKFHVYYVKNLPEFLETINRTRIPEEDLDKMPLNPIHSDFHPGNLKFKDNRVVGIFDFDWCKIDLRIFDVALAMVYACCSWLDESDGVLLLDKCRIFLESYQRTLTALNGLAPLNETEIHYLPTMIAAANMYLINWTVTAFYTGSDLNVYEYLAYLQHNVRVMKWIENHGDEILQVGKSLEY